MMKYDDGDEDDLRRKEVKRARKPLHVYRFFNYLRNLNACI